MFGTVLIFCSFTKFITGYEIANEEHKLLVYVCSLEKIGEQQTEKLIEGQKLRLFQCAAAETEVEIAAR